MKRIISFVCIVCLILSLFTVISVSAKRTEDGFLYEISDGGIIITGYIGTDTDVIIPSEIEGIKIKEIGNAAFSLCEDITSVIIPDGVFRIGGYAFSCCDNLVSITIPDSVSVIENNAFSYSSVLRKVIIPEGIEKIEDDTFIGCSNIRVIKIPNSVKSIGERAFRSCTNLEIIRIPNSVKTIGEDAFSSCVNIDKILYEGTESDWNTVEYSNSELQLDDVIFNSGLYNDDFIYEVINETDVSILKYIGSDENVIIPEKIVDLPVKIIEEEAFLGKTKIKNIEIPYGVTEIGLYAFSECTGLTSITIPESVTKIMAYSFNECQSLRSIVVPDSVVFLGGSVFRDCEKLSSVKLSSNINHIPYACFSGCDSLITIYVPQNILRINAYSFSECSNLTTVIISSELEYVDSYAFENCKQLTNVYYCGSESKWYDVDIQNNNEELVRPKVCYETQIYNNEYVYIKENSSSLKIVKYLGFDKNIDIPKEIEGVLVNSIMNGAFAGKTVDSINIPKCIYKIEDNAFAFCTQLSDVYYSGTKEQWNSVNVDNGNECLTNATIHYESDESTNENTKGYLNDYAEIVKNAIAVNESAVSYEDGRGFLFDVDGNGIDELILMYNEKSDYEGMSNTVYSIYSASNNNAVSLIKGKVLFVNAGGPSGEVRIGEKDGKNYIVAISDTGETGWSPVYLHRWGDFYTYEVKGDSLFTEYEISRDYYADSSSPAIDYERSCATINGTKCDFREYEAIRDSYTIIKSTDDAMTLPELLKYIESIPTDDVNKNVLGDANSDGKVNIKDATQVQKAVAGLVTLSKAENLAADVDGNKNVNVKDATVIQKAVAGMDTGYPVGK